MKRNATTVMAHSDRALAAKLRAEAAEYAAAEIAQGGRPHSATAAVWHEIVEAERRGLTYAAWARKRRAVFNGVLRTLWIRCGGLR